MVFWKTERKLVLVLTLLAIFMSTNCSPTTRKQGTSNIEGELGAYITGFTAGQVSRTTTIHVIFAEDLAGVDALGEVLGDPPIEFAPKLDGTAQWIDARTLQFTPAELLEPDTIYTAKVDLKTLFDHLPKALHRFSFGFHTPRREWEIHIGSLRHQPGKGRRWQELKGTVITSDFEFPDSVERAVQAAHGDAYLPIEWTHDEGGRTHQFTVRGIKRQAEATAVIATWRSSEPGLSFDGKREIPVPSARSFLVVNAQRRSSQEQCISLIFSDPVKEDQDLRGLIHSAGRQWRLVIDSNVIHAYPQSRLSGPITVTVEPGIENVLGAKLSARKSFTVQFDAIKPEIKLARQKVIIPSSTKTMFPFEAANLSAVDVQVTKIPGDNLHQFFQVNALDGHREIYRVGTIVLQERVDLDPSGERDLHNWNRHVLDISKLVALEPGAMYRVSIGFRPSYSLYPGSEDITGGMDIPIFPALREKEHSAWNSWCYNPYDHYRHRDDPCHLAYYGIRRTQSRNVLASNLGIMAKIGTRGPASFFVTDLLTAKPVAGAHVEIFDFTKDRLGSTITDHDGHASMVLKDQAEPFLVVAGFGQQRGYLRLNDGKALSTSRFDVGGAQRNDGLDGFIYGDRGVWRPGDTLHLTFVLRDPAGTLPRDHPISFELTDPERRVVNRQTVQRGVGNMYVFDVKTDPAAQTGFYQARVSVGGSGFNKTLRIETVMPNRLKINLDVGTDSLYANSDETKASLNVRWLHGAVAKHLNTKIKAQLAPIPTRFARFSDFVFDDPGKVFEPTTQELFDGPLNAHGDADFSFQLTCASKPPGKLQARFLCQAFEPGGAFSVDHFSIPYHPYPRYVGVRLPPGDRDRGMLLTDREHQVDIVALDPDGHPVAQTGLSIEVYKLSWRWWWDQNADQITSYRANQLIRPILSDTVATDQHGQANWDLRIDYPNWGRYLIRVIDPDGHSCGKVFYIDWPGWAGRQREFEPGGAAMLNFAADKDHYAVGEDATLSIPTSQRGQLLISLESGERVLETHWIEAAAGVTQFSFRTKADMAPNIYAHVTLLQPHAQTDNDLPIRLYGILNIRVEDPRSHLHPRLDMPDVLEPETTVDIAVTESSGRPMTYTLAVLDEGLLDLTRFRTPNPWHHFFTKQALRVKSWDVFDDVLGAFGGQLKALLSIGGGQRGGEMALPKANRFTPMVRFLGPFELEPGARAVHRVDIPLYMGSVRTMLVAAGEGCYGSAEKTTPVRKPLILFGTLPRVLSPGESVALPMTVFAQEDHIESVDIRLETNELLVPQTIQKTIHFNQPGEQTVTFPLNVAASLGWAHISAYATSGRESTEFHLDVQVRNPNPVIRESRSAIIQPQCAWTPNLSPLGMDGTNSAVLEISAQPPINLAKHLDYLIRYPHGCVEQTTSAAFPQLFLSRVIELSRADQEKIDDHIKAALTKLAFFQLGNGSMAYWPGSPKENLWGTNYAGHFMLAAKNLGYSLPHDMFDKWLNFQKLHADIWDGQSASDELVQAYRLYLLALAGTPEMGAMNRFKERHTQRDVCQWLLAAAYHRAGHADIAKTMTRALSIHVPEYFEMNRTFGSALRDRAMILDAMSHMGHPGRSKMAQRVASDLNGHGQGYNTQNLGYGLMALTAHKDSSGIAFSFILATDNTSQTIESPKPIFKKTIDIQGDSRLHLTNIHTTQVYACLTLSGQPLDPVRSETNSHLKLEVSYTDLDGDTIDPMRIVQGTDFFAEFTVCNPGDMGDYQEMALTHIVPSGWEIHNARLTEFRDSGVDLPQYQNIRDDRIDSYFDIDSRQTKTFRIMLNAAYLGRFQLPSVQAEAMYRHQIHAHQRGAWTEVVAAERAP